MIRTGLVVAAATFTTAFFARLPYQGGDLARRVTGHAIGLVL